MSMYVGMIHLRERLKTHVRLGSLHNVNWKSSFGFQRMRSWAAARGIMRWAGGGMSDVKPGQNIEAAHIKEGRREVL